MINSIYSLKRVSQAHLSMHRFQIVNQMLIPRQNVHSDDSIIITIIIMFVRYSEINS